MNTLLLTDWFLPHAGGSRVYYYHIYKSLADEFGHNVTILTKKVPSWRSFDAMTSVDNFRIVRHFKPLETRSYTQLPKVVLPLMDVIPHLCRARPRIVHCGDFFPQGAVCWFLNRIAGLQYLLYCHGEEITQTKLRRYQWRMCKAIFREAAVVIAANDFARHQLLSMGIPAARIHTITPGVDFERFQPSPPKRELVERFDLEGKRVLLTVARLTPRKGHLTILKALAGLLATAPDTRYVIVGKGPEEARLRRAVADLGIADAVKFAGFVPDEELPAFYNLCDIFVMPNSFDATTGDIEGFGMVFLEANAASKPVVGGRSGGTVQAIIEGTTGYLVEPDNVEELEAVLRVLLNNPDLCARLGRAGMLRARTEFSWRSRAAQVAALSRGEMTQDAPIGPELVQASAIDGRAPSAK